MEYKGYRASIKRAPKLSNHRAHGLPPGTAIDVYPVDAFEDPLPNWIKGPGNYVVPVDSDWGLWFDWTMNDRYNTAVLPTVKGMNPVTGRKTEGYGLEKYENKCPVHGIEFKDGLFCKECNYRWPHQNYVAAPNTLWWDGFRTADGKVRQFFFTEDLAKSIPELVVGKENTIPAFGFAFYKPKNPRSGHIAYGRGCTGQSIFGELSVSDTIGSVNYDSFTLCRSGSVGLGTTDPTYIFTCLSNTSADKLSQSSTLAQTASSVQLNGNVIKDSMQQALQTHLVSTHPKSFQQETKTSCGEFKSSVKGNDVKKRSITAEVGVGAGAEIYQDLAPDTLKIDEWEEEPAAVMRLYFVFIEQFKEIAAKGMKDLSGNKEGFLAGLPVG
jgi:hypothetical protein